MGLSLSTISLTALYQQFTELITQNMVLAPHYPMTHDSSSDDESDNESSDDESDNESSDDSTSHDESDDSSCEGVREESELVFNPVKSEVNFRCLKDELDVMKVLIDTTVTDTQYNDNVIDFLAKFVDKYINKDKLKTNAFSKKVWECEYKTTREYIELIFKDAIKKKVTFGKLIQYIIQNIVIDEFSGFTIHDARTSRTIQAISYMNHIKQKNMEYNIGKAFNGVDRGIMFLTEYDHPPIYVEGVDFTQIQMCGNRSKAVVTKNMKVEIITYEIILDEILKRHKRSKYIIDCIKHEETKEMICLMKVDNIYFLGVHLKSIGNKPAAKKNVPLYITTKCVIDWLKELRVEFFIFGDFNIPFLHEDTYIGFDSKDADWHPLQEPSKEHCLNYEMTRISPFHKDTLVHLKKRTSDSTKNAQASVGKFYEDGREGITDFVFHYLPKTQEERDWCDSKYDETAWVSKYSPQDPTIECIPFVADSVEKSFCSDHQMLECRNGKNMVGTWNVLSEDCSPPAAYREDMTSEQIEKANDELAEIINKVYNTM